MAMPVIGTIHNAGKLAALEMKWQQKKKNGGVDPDMDPQMRQIQQFQEDLERMQEGKKLSDISVKLKSGGTLTDEELAYLKKNNPQMYQDAVAVEKERENYKRRLNQCRSKEEVEKFKVLEMNGALSEAKSIMHNPRIPEAEKVKLMDRILARTMGIQAEHMTFVKSPAYIRLPDREADALKKKGRGKTQQPAELPAVEDRRDTQEEQELPDISEIPETPELPGMAEQEDTAASETELSGAQPHTDLAEAAYSKLKAAIRGKKA